MFLRSARCDACVETTGVRICSYRLRSPLQGPDPVRNRNPRSEDCTVHDPKIIRVHDPHISPEHVTERVRNNPPIRDTAQHSTDRTRNRNPLSVTRSVTRYSTVQARSAYKIHSIRHPYTHPPQRYRGTVDVRLRTSTLHHRDFRGLVRPRRLTLLRVWTCCSNQPPKIKE